MLQIDLESRYRQDAIITQIRQIVKNFNIAVAESDPKKAPFRNVLNVAMEPASSLETIKTYIRYQSGRRETNKVWVTTYDNQRFANGVIASIDALSNDVKGILEEVKNRLDDREIKDYLTDQKDRIEQDLHLKLARLYFGYLYREYTAAIGESPTQGDRSSKSQSKGQDSPKPKLSNKSENPTRGGNFAATQRPQPPHNHHR
ncbi:hypothetical protein ACN4EG_17085 [Alkalinema pantanalense CENA528]|uniref:hypothetical protein n=1 Tax=Alkalinema pantanalense TaxID=1620705 RepID=UPI003D6F79CA